jgi:hypothetical protein
MPTSLSIYCDNMDWLKKEFKMSETSSLYDVVNKLCDEYKVLKNNQSKEIENGNRTESRRERKQAG